MSDKEQLKTKPYSGAYEAGSRQGKPVPLYEWEHTDGMIRAGVISNQFLSFSS